MRYRFLPAVFLMATFLPVVARADLDLGFLSFDNLIPGAPGSPGVNAFNIANLTGDPGFGGYALPPTFPILTSVTFLNSSLTLTSNGFTTTLMIGDIGPGFFTAPLEYPDTQAFSAAVFTAQLDGTMFSLADGSTFMAGSPLVTTSLLPSAGKTLVAGTDFGLITAPPAVSGVPEPRSLVLLATVGLLFVHRIKART